MKTIPRVANDMNPKMAMARSETEIPKTRSLKASKERARNWRQTWIEFEHSRVPPTASRHESEISANVGLRAEHAVEGQPASLVDAFMHPRVEVVGDHVAGQKGD